MLKGLSLAILSGSMLMMAGDGLAGSDVVVMADEAKQVSVSGEASTVVVGNPSIADVTVHGPDVFVHGRSYGSTNLIVLDKQGNQIANLDVTVMQGGNNNLTVFRGAGKYSYVCAPQCQSTLQIGDKQDYFDSVETETGKKIGLATGLAK